MHLFTVSTKLHLRSKVLKGSVSPQIIVVPTTVVSTAQVWQIMITHMTWMCVSLFSL